MRYHFGMAVPGPHAAGYIDRSAANTLKLVRIRTGMSQRDLAAAAGVPQSTVARIESGAMQPTHDPDRAERARRGGEALDRALATGHW